jgi:hypothetical protein
MSIAVFLSLHKGVSSGSLSAPDTRGIVGLQNCTASVIRAQEIITPSSVSETPTCGVCAPINSYR